MMRLRRFLTLAALTAVTPGTLACTDEPKTTPGTTKDSGIDSGKLAMDASRSHAPAATGSAPSASARSTASSSPVDASSDAHTPTQGPRDSGWDASPIATSGSEPPDASTPDSSTDAGCQSGGGSCGADLTISSATLNSEGFTTVEVSDTSCEIQEGCYSGSGKRTVIPFELTITNTGTLPLEIGAPWESQAFYRSACASLYHTTNFVKAEVLSDSGQVLAVRRLPTSCVADENSTTYSCSVQGLDVGELSEQPSHTCNGLDVTGLAAGAYSIRFTVNADGKFPETDFSNNSFEVALEKPECEARFCGGVCCPDSAECAEGVCLLPDLRANLDAVQRSLIIGKQTFGEDACELEEMCITGPGKRRLLKFEGRIENVGTGDLNPGVEQNNPLFEFSACHDHYHFLDFTDYKLLDPNGAVAVQGHKQSFCLISMDRVEDYVSPVLGEVVHPEPGEVGCNYLEAGWADIYSVGTPCQWVDVTDLPAGDYVLQVAVNPVGSIAESNVENNVIQVPVHIPEDAPCQAEEVCGDVADQDCDGVPDPSDEDCKDSAFCCGGEDVCGFGGNHNCDCNGEPAWEQHDCESGGGDGGVIGGECCSAEDTCNWANDSVCDCGGAFEWDTIDCQEPVDRCCTEANECDWAEDTVCDCGGSMSWDHVDCDGEQPDAGTVFCCTEANACHYANDHVCDCQGQMSWDHADCDGDAGPGN